MGDWLTETLNLGAFDYLYKFTIILSIFLLGGSFIVKKKKERKKTNRQCRYCLQDCHRSPGQRIN